MIDAVASDFDGLLTDSKGRLSLGAVTALRRLEENDIPVILNSGMSYCALRKISSYLGCSGAVIAENGAIVAYKDDKRIIGTGEEVKRILTELMKRGDARLKESWSNPYRHVGLVLERSSDIIDLKKTLKNHPRVKLIDSGVAYHLLDRDVDKGRGLRVAADMMNIDLKSIAAIGDSETDLELLEAAGLKIALAHSPKLLKKKADFITKQGYGEGFEEAVKFILKTSYD